ncbi:MAG: PAS domain S-box protein [Gammaproteobacteria bacterium]
MSRRRAIAGLVLALIVLLPGMGFADDITLGIYAYRPKAVMLTRYEPLARYLDTGLGPDVDVHLEILELSELEAAIQNNRIDLVFTNPRHYILLRNSHTLSGAIATLNKLGFDGGATSSLGGVILTQAGRSDIASLDDIRGLKVATANSRHMGGYQCQAYELMQAGVSLAEENEIIETGRHDDTVRAVLAGDADVGLVRTEILEDMAREGALDLDRIRVINPQSLRDYPFVSSTRLYPEWPMVALPHLAPDIARRVSALLLSLEPDHEAARAAGIAGFVPPADYLAVETIARALRLAPYDHVPEVPLIEIWHQNKATLTLSALSIILITLLLILLSRRNLRLRELLVEHKKRERASQLISDVSALMLNAGADRADQALDSVLELAGLFMGADRAYLFSSDRTHCDNTHEWRARDVESLMERNQHLPLESAPWWWDGLDQIGSVIVDDIRALPAEAARERALLSERGIRAVAGIALRMDGRVSGFIGFDSVHGPRDWSDRDVGLLTLLAQLVAGAQRRWDAERARAEGESYFRTLFESSADGIAIADTESMTVVQANPRMHEMLGYPDEALIGQPVSALHPESAWEEVQRYFAAQLRGEFTLAPAMPIRYHHGGTGYADISTGPFEIKGRMHMIGHFRDVTERLQADERMRMLEFALDHTAEATYLADADGRLEYTNRGAARMLGYARDEMQDLHVADVDADFPAEHWPGHFEVLRRVGSITFEREHRRKDGSTIPVEVNANYVNYQGRDYDLGFARDITQRKEAEQAIRASEERLALAGKAAFDLIYEWDPAASTIRWFGDIDGLLGYPPGAISTALEHWLDILHPDDRPGLESALVRHRTGDDPMDYTYRIRTHEGDWRVWNDRALPVLDEEGQPSKWVGVCSDITDKHRSQERLRLAASVFTHAREGIFVTDMDSNFLAVNSAFETLTGYTGQEVLGRNARLLQSGLHDKGFFRDMYAALEEDGVWQGEVWNRRKDGERFAAFMTLSSVNDEDGELTHYVGLFSDITEQKSHEAQLEHIAHHDALTDLPNRALLADRLYQAMAQARRRHHHVAVIYLDLDGFKQINDTLGHEAGDLVLITLGKRMRDALRETDTVGRLGGDEFVAILADLDTVDGTVPVLERLLKAMNTPIPINGSEQRVSASLGVTFYPQAEDVDGDQLLRQADQAMYQAKTEGKNRYRIFGDEADSAVRGRHTLLTDLQNALKQAQLTVFYQPRVNMATGAVDGAEALVRWKHPTRGLLLPDQFLPSLSNQTLAADLDWQVMETVFRQVELWRHAAVEIPISINVGSALLQREDFPDQLRARLEAHPGVSPGLIELEIQETRALEDLTQASMIITRCNELGVKFSLDDFGTGSSSLAYLKTLPTAYLKIDTGFVRDMLTDSDDLAILDGVIALASAFSRKAIAEGVEHLEQGRMLLRLGCELAQGYAIAPPMPAEEFITWLPQWRTPGRWRDVGPVERNDIPVLFASVAHGAWLHALSEFIDGERDSPPESEVHACRFGQWLDGDAQLRFGEHPEFADLHHCHERIHLLAAQRLERAAARNDGNTESDAEAETEAEADARHAEALLAEHERLLNLLDGLINDQGSSE